ncbi:unnamed protein product, partial [marine sediment metagenome]
TPLFDIVFKKESVQKSIEKAKKKDAEFQEQFVGISKIYS